MMRCNLRAVCAAGFPCLPESRRIILVKFPVVENDFGPGRLWHFALKVLESPGFCWDANAMLWTWT